MIKLTKGPSPDILVRLAATWTQALLDRIAKGEKPTDAEKSRYRHPDIKTALTIETHAKCAYCESKVRHITHGDIDHIVPKSTAPEKAFEWTNLTLACDLCNENKSDHFGNHEDLVDPYAIHPSEHFLFEGPLILPIPGSDPGLMTETVLKLNRSELVERRQDKIRHLLAQVHALARIRDAALRSVVRKDIVDKECTVKQEYAGLARHVVGVLLAALDNIERGQTGTVGPTNTTT
jgi:hypothetical protein